MHVDAKPRAGHRRSDIWREISQSQSQQGMYCPFLYAIIFHFVQASDLIQKFDEHSVSHKHKIGVIYQKMGQVRTLCYVCGWWHDMYT